MEATTKTRQWSRSALVVEDSRMERRILGDCLAEAGYSVRYAHDLLSAKHELENTSVNVVLLDMRLPDGNGAELIEALAQTRPDIAVVVVSGDEQVGTRVRALRLGAADYLVKPYNPEELLARVDAVVAAQMRRSQRAQAAQSDELTGVLGRSPWLARFREAVQTQAAGTVVVADVAGFRAFNSCYGWDSGDEALLAVVQALSTALPVDAVVGRSDGDEFAVVLPQVGVVELGLMLSRAETSFRRLLRERFGSDVHLRLQTAAVDWSIGADPERVWARAQFKLARQLRRWTQHAVGGAVSSKPKIHAVPETVRPEGVRYAIA